MRMQHTVPLSDAKTNLSELVESASRGEDVTITKRGKPVAKLTAHSTKDDRKRRAAAIDRMIERRTKRSLRGLSIPKMIREGRK
jgi:prevent-host-death family protein